VSGRCFAMSSPVPTVPSVQPHAQWNNAIINASAWVFIMVDRGLDTSPELLHMFEAVHDSST